MTGLAAKERHKFRVSVIIPVLNDTQRLTACLDALSCQTWPCEQLEVLVVDNGSQDDLAPLLARYEFARLLFESQPGSYAARNAGLQAATGNVIAFTDSDCLPEPQWLEAGVAAIAEKGPLVVAGGRVQLFAAEPETPTWAEDFELAVGFSQQTYVETRHYSVTANLFTTPHTLSRVGPFNAQLKSGGDKEWGQRAHAQGVPLVYAADALVRHPARRSLADLLRKRRRLVGGHLGIARTQHAPWVAFSLCLAKACLPPFSRVRKASRRSTDDTEGTRTKLRRLRRAGRVLAVGTSLQVVSIAELIRLQLGGAPRR